MRTDFRNAEDYLSYLQAIYSKPYTDGTVADEEFHRLTKEALQNINVDMPSGHLSGLQIAIDKSYCEIVQALTPDRRAEVESQIAAGILETGQVEAFIARSADGKFAILFSSGLAMFLHKYIKLVSALTDPTAVTYCNRMPAEKLTKNDIREYLDEMIAYCVTYSVPRGPLIKLRAEETARSTMILKCAETFILCHELSHFLNGDLRDLNSYSALPPGMPGNKYEENKNHEVEHKADILGYELYLNTLTKLGIVAPPKAILSPVIMMFDLFYQFSGGASSTHPHPYDRIVRIVRKHFDPKLALRLAEALRKPELLPDVMPISEH